MSLNEIFRNKRRIYQEYKKFYKDCYSDIYTFLELSHLTVLLEVNGPKNSIYENKKYKIKMTLTNGYPFAPPKVEFLTPIIHPNIYKGQICVDMLTYNWTPAYTIHTIMIYPIKSCKGISIPWWYCDKSGMLHPPSCSILRHAPSSVMLHHAPTSIMLRPPSCSILCHAPSSVMLHFLHEVTHISSQLTASPSRVAV